MADKGSVEAVKGLIHKTAAGVEDSAIEYEPDSYGDMDAMDESDIEALETMPEEETAEEPEAEATPSIDWQLIAQQQQQELARYKAEEAERQRGDLKRRVEELPEEERVPYLLNYQQEQERKAEIEEIRRAQITEYPLGSMVFDKVSSYFDVELDDPGSYRTAIAGMNEDFSKLLTELVETRVKQEMDKFYGETGREWGMDKLGSAQPRGLQPKNPIRNQYEQTRKELAKPGVVKTTDTLTTLIRQRQNAKG